MPEGRLEGSSERPPQPEANAQRNRLERTAESGSSQGRTGVSACSWPGWLQQARPLARGNALGSFLRWAGLPLQPDTGRDACATFAGYRSLSAIRQRCPDSRRASQAVKTRSRTRTISENTGRRSRLYKGATYDVFSPRDRPFLHSEETRIEPLCSLASGLPSSRFLRTLSLGITPPHTAALVRQSFRNTNAEKRPRGGLELLSGRLSFWVRFPQG